jgi:hypothetical protein
VAYYRAIQGNERNNVPKRGNAKGTVQVTGLTSVPKTSVSEDFNKYITSHSYSEAEGGMQRVAAKQLAQRSSIAIPSRLVVKFGDSYIAMKPDPTGMNPRTYLQIRNVVDKVVYYLGTLLALDRPILSRPLTTILDLPTTSLEAWISQAKPTILRCISDANDAHEQTNAIDDYFPRRRDG